MLLTNYVLMLNWIFEIELIIYLKMDLALNNLPTKVDMPKNQTKPSENGNSMLRIISTKMSC